MEVSELTAGLLEARGADATDLEVVATDGRDLYDVQLHAPAVRYVRRGPLDRAALRQVDVAWVHLPIPSVHLRVALRLRLRGVPVVLSAMTMLSTEFAYGRWTFSSSRLPLRAKPFAVAGLRLVWSGLATAFSCVSGHEIRTSGFERSRCAVAPWPLPRSGLADAARAAEAVAIPGPSGTRPVAFLSRWDVRRKGIDRLCAWLCAYEASLPRPAALLFARATGPVPDTLPGLVERGVLVWDQERSGAELLDDVRRCRAVMTLSRFDGLPRVLREAAALGLPTIATASANVAELSAVVEKGTVVDGDDVDAVQRAFERADFDDLDPTRARVLLDRRAIGAFNSRVLAGVARGRLPGGVDHYREVASRLASEEAGGTPAAPGARA